MFRSRSSQLKPSEQIGWRGHPTPWLRLAHLTLIFTIIITASILRITYGGEDIDVKNLEVLVSLAGVAWMAAISIAVVIHGDKRKVLKSWLSAYQSLLTNRSFLMVSIAVLLALQVFVLTNLLLYRPVQFYSATDVELILSDKPGSATTLGFIEAETLANIRLKIGVRHIAYKVPSTGGVGALPPMRVPGWWSNEVPPVVRIPELKTYEQLR